MKNNTTKKNTYSKKQKINGKIVSKKEGWVTLHIYGNAFERGYAHGTLLADNIKYNIDVLPLFVNEFYHISYEEYRGLCIVEIKPNIIIHHKEFYDELVGIETALREHFIDIDVDDLICWNSIMCFYSHSVYQKKSNTSMRCSAFIATGDATQHNDIVMAHNTHTHYMDGIVQNIILYITPSKGFPFVMQCSAGNIASGTDWFISSSGIMGCETTIYGINYKPVFGSPFFCRIRKALQYGKSIDEYVKIMLANNAGDYACSWLLGNTNNNEIACFELGLKEHSLKKTYNGVYYGMNSTMDNHLRTMETIDNDIYNISTSTGARRFRMNQLLNNTYYGNISIQTAKNILSDHYNVYTNKESPSSRTICRHSDHDNSKKSSNPFYPFGSTDGKIVNSENAKQLKFFGRFGHFCGRTFVKSTFIKKHPKYAHMEKWMTNMDSRDWVFITK
jgi:hypothetical protein